jgi:hypothetical protein
MILSDGTTSINLPDDLEWTDETAYSVVEQSTEHTLTGALVVDVGARLAGRPITLTGGDDVWVTRAVVDALRAWADTPGQTLTLTMTGYAAMSVMFRLQDGPGVEARPVLFAAPISADDAYTITLYLMEI